MSGEVYQVQWNSRSRVITCYTVRVFLTSAHCNKIQQYSRRHSNTGRNRRNGPDFERVFLMLNYEGRSEINASYFIMLAHDVRGEYC